MIVASSSASITPAMRNPNRSICVGGVDLILESLRIIIVDAG